MVGGMRIFLRLGLTTGFALTMLAPASAHPGGVCSWVMVNAHLSKPLRPGETNILGTFVSNVGPTCAFSIVIYSGNCLNSVGSGTVWDGVSTHTFDWLHTGNRVVFTGGFQGSSSFDPNVLVGDSCVVGADDFLMTGSGTTF